VVRYSIFSRGKFTERGIEERHTAAVDLHRTELAEMVKVFVSLEPGQELPLLRGLLAALKDGTPPAVKGVRRLTELLQKASYGVIFFGRGITYGPAREVLDGLAELTAWMNHRTPFILFPLSADFNSVGLYHLLLRELGSPLAPDFGDAPGFTSHAEPVAMASVDALVVVGADLFWFLSGEEINDLKKRRVPVVVLSPFANRTTGHADVVIPVPLAGLETSEIAFRMDGLPLYLPEVISSPLRPDSQVLRDLAEVLM
jgi:formylmethanofuran dehydrogenase subunit B